MGYSLQVSSVHGVFQARILEWVVFSFSSGTSWPRDQTQPSCIAGSLLHCRQILYWLSHHYHSNNITNLDSVLRSKDITLPTKIHYSQSYGFSSSHTWMWELDHKKGWGIDAFKLSCWRVPWTAKRSNQSTLKEVNSEYSLEGLMLKLKLQYFSHLMWRADSLEKTLMLGKIEGKRRRGWQRIRWVDSITDSMDMNLSKFWKIVKDREAWYAAFHGVTKSQI